MSEFQWVQFDNKVPKAFAKNCQGFNLEVPIEKGYKQASKKVLIVIGKVPTQDLIAGRLLGGESKGLNIMSNVLEEAKKWGRNFGEIGNFKTAVINFNYFKNYHLGDEAYRASVKANTKRVKRYIKRLKPDLIVVFGDEAMDNLQPSEKNLKYRRGSVFTSDVRPKAKIVGTLEWEAMMPSKKDSGRGMIDKANLLGYAFRTVSHGLLGNHPLSLKKVKPKPVLVKNLKMFKRMMKRMRKSQAVAVDTETGGLQVLKNRIATIQFANSAKKGYVVVLDHQDTPFTAKEIAYIKKDLQAYFSERHMYQGDKTKYLIMQNGKFDMRILRATLNIPFIYWPLWDTLAGEFCLDENINHLSKVNTPAFNLAQIFARYDNDFYYRAEFSKSERHLLAENPIGKKELDYCAMDVQSIWAVHKMQQATASIMDFRGKSYLTAYRRLVLVQMSNNIHGMSSMYLRGNPLDQKHLIHIASKQSPILKLMDEEMEKLKKMPAAIKANEKLSGLTGAPKIGLFGKAKTPWILSLDKQDHKEMLYLKVLKLDPVNTNEESGRVSMDKWFQKAHKDVPEIQVLTRKNKLAILRNTFAKGILRQASDDPDVKLDGRLRPDYGYEGVVSGRSNSFKPSLQQIPEHSGEAKIIKRMFIAEDGKIHIKMDYSSHEVRGWGYIAGDDKVASSFQSINDLINKFRAKPTPKTLLAMQLGGDIHKINYSMFTGVPVDKVDKVQRQSAKQIVFGSIYGMSAASLAEQLGMDEDEAQGLIDKFFSKAAKAKKWLDFTAEHAQKHYYAFSPLGRRRNLYANMTEIRRIVSGCNRRAQNAPIQGMASDFGFNAARLMEMCIYETFRKIGRSHKDCMMLSAGVMQMVHDSIKLEMEYKDFYVVLWIVEYCAVYGLRKLVEETFGFKLNVDFAIEVEVGTIGDQFEKWDWQRGYETTTNPNDAKDVRYGIKQLIKLALESQNKELGTKNNVKKTIKMMVKEGKKHRAYLRKHFPLPHEPL